MRRENGSIWVLLFLLFAFSLSAITALTASAKEKSDLSARAAALYEPSSGRFLYSENKDARLPMASTTKIMTALIAAEKLSPDELISVPSEAVGTEGSSAYFAECEELSAKGVLYALLLRSANDAAVTLAVHISGSVEGFALLMNERADALGLTDTRFTNPHGLHNEEHYTTAGELAKIAAAALANPLIKEIAATKKASVTTSLGEKIFVNHNKLLVLYKDAVGVKTGFTKAAGRCLVGAAERDGVLLISVTLNAPTDWKDHQRMLDLGFSLTERKVLAATGDFAYTLPVIGSDKETVRVSLKDEVGAVLLKTDKEVKAEVSLPRYIVAPKGDGEAVGKVIFTLDGVKIAEGDLCTESAAMTDPKEGLIQKIKKIFNR